MLDKQALADRLYADALAADLREPESFLRSKMRVTADQVDQCVRARSKTYREDLSATEAEAEWGVQDALNRWQTIAFGGPVPRGSSGDESWRTVGLLSRAARQLLQPNGGEMILRVDANEPGREILRWRFVSLTLPPSIIIAAAMRGTVRSPSGVRLLHSSLAPDCPVAHQHVHHAAMMSFDELWASLKLRVLLRPSEVETSLRNKRAFCPHLHSGPCLRGTSTEDRNRAKRRPAESARHMDLWGALIRNAFIAARVLERHAGHAARLQDCHDKVCTQGRVVLRAFSTGRSNPYGPAEIPYPWNEELVRIARRYREANAPASFRRSQTPRRRIIDEQTRVERSLLARAFAHLRPNDKESPDAAYETLFLQYLRVKTALFRLLVHPPGERGLKKFLDHFEQIKVYVPDADILSPRVPNEPGLRVHSTEYRVATDAWMKILERRDRYIEDPSSLGLNRHESAWLIHFKRKPRKDTLPFFGAAVRELEAEATQIGNALDQEPTRLRELRGIDVCGVEEAQPLWVSAETLRRLRARSSDIAGRRPSLGLQPLRLTLHAGEDFRWLTSGMRAIAEPFHWKLIERGDRIGHGIAVTLDPVGWWDRHQGQVIPVTRFDRLLDLAFLAEYAEKRTPAQEAWLRQQIAECVRVLRLPLELGTGKRDDVVTAAKNLWRNLGGRSTRRLMTTLQQPEEILHHNWIHRYLWDRSLQKRAAAKIRLPVEKDRNERDLLVKARAALIHEIARWQVCIESNPSSNLVVASLDAMASQDFLGQRPTRVAPEGKETLTWTISTDDPITFSTTLADEYAYAWAGMVLREEKPYDPSYARALLDEAAATSMRTRFTIPREDQDRTNKDTRKRRGNAPPA